jgi:hypothetical protein
MLNSVWVRSGNTLGTGARFSACDPFPLPFEGFSRPGTVYLKGRRFISGGTTKDNDKEKSLC